ncbi:MAG: sulfatase-like hydrolase/transferase [bacterium]|nr:sulfatase-like hydrolase/transferase [bacterium]
MPNRPNILFLLSDEHSHRFLSAREPEHGGEPCRTPNLDRLTRNGAHFSTAYCQMPLCTPSRISMLAGRHSHRCGAWGNNSVLNPELPTFASHLGAHGYDTVTIGKMHLGGALQHAGFGARPYGDFGGPCSHQEDPLEKTTSDPMRARTRDAGISQIPESCLQEQMVVRESIAYLREHRHRAPDRPWLLYASFSRPHFPLTAPRRFFERYHPKGVTPPRIGRTGDTINHPMTLGAIKGFRTNEIDHVEMMKARAAYFACVDYLDETIGDFLSILEWDGLLDNTIVIYASDHGEIAGEHGLWWKNTWHEAAARVPFIVSLPQHRSGDLSPSQITTPISLADVFPTLCGLTSTPPPEGLDGIDLSPAIHNKPCPALTQRPGVITESLTPRWGEGTEFRMIRSDRFKYVAFRGCEDLAFDLQEDPDEQHNLANRATGEVATELETLRTEALRNFDFDKTEQARKRETEELQKKYPKRVTPKTPNQILLGNGHLVEADAPLYQPQTVTDNPARDFDDFPK